MAVNDKIILKQVDEKIREQSMTIYKEEIVRLNNEASVYQEEIEKLKKEVASSKQENDRLTSKLKTSEEDNKKLRESLEEKDSELFRRDCDERNVLTGLRDIHKSQKIWIKELQMSLNSHCESSTLGDLSSAVEKTCKPKIPPKKFLQNLQTSSSGSSEESKDDLNNNSIFFEGKLISTKTINLVADTEEDNGLDVSKSTADPEEYVVVVGSEQALTNDAEDNVESPNVTLDVEEVEEEGNQEVAAEDDVEEEEESGDNWGDDVAAHVSR